MANGFIPPLRFAGNVSLRDRLESRSIPEPNSGCFLWMAALGTNGYGYMQWDGRIQSAHRLAWISQHGQISDLLHVCHRCDNRVCVNPGHLFLGTNADNSSDRIKKGRSARGEKHGGAKLSLQDILLIRSDPRKQKEIAAEYGIVPSAVSNIKSRRVWAWV